MPSPASPARTPQSRDPFRLLSVPADLRRYILTCFIAGLAVLATCIAALIMDDQPVGGTFVIITLFYLAVNMLPTIELKRGNQEIKYRFNEVPTLLALALGPVYLIPLAAFVAELQPLARDYFKDPDNRFKIPFNLGQLLVTVGITVAIGQIGGPPLPFIVAAVVAAIIGDLMIYRAMYLADGPTIAEQLRSGWETRAGIPAFVGLLCSGLILLGAQAGGALTIAAIPVAIVALYIVCSFVLAIYRDRAAWRTLDEVVSSMLTRGSVSGQPTENEIISAALQGALDLFEVRRVEIILHEPNFTYSIENVANRRIHAQPHPPGEVVLPPDETSTVVARELNTQGGRSPGWIVLHFGSKVQDKRAEERNRLVTTFAAQVASNIMVARTYQYLKANAEQKAHEALHDGLTGLGNREMLYEQAPRMLSESQAAGKTSALLLFDLDGFKRINDTLGHNAGDLLLREVAQRTQASVRKSDLAVRLGGDEFAVLATDLNIAADAEMVASNLIKFLIPPVHIEGMRLTVEASIGIAVYGIDGDDIHALLRLSDVAMYEAKNRGRGTWCRYNASTNTNSAEQLSLTTDLRNAIDKRELVLHYQPQIATDTNQVVGMEALVRWEHPELGLIPPYQFVPLAEHSGMIRRFTLAIFDMAIADHARLREITPNTTMSVNLSARNLLDQGLPEDVGRILARHGVPPHEVIVEITETVAPSDSSAVDKVLSKLNALGCQISLDDFGTGYSSLSSLRRTTYGEVKVDRDFVKDILVNPAAATMVQAIVDIAHGHNCKVVAEGVENQAVLHRLREMNCDVAQGFYIARPAPYDAVVQWLEAWKAEHRTVNTTDDSKIVDFASARRVAREGTA